MNKKFSKLNLNAYQFTSICTSLAVCEFMKGIAVKTVKTIRVQNIKIYYMLLLEENHKFDILERIFYNY